MEKHRICITRCQNTKLNLNQIMHHLSLHPSRFIDWGREGQENSGKRKGCRGAWECYRRERKSHGNTFNRCVRTYVREYKALLPTRHTIWICRGLTNTSIIHAYFIIWMAYAIIGGELLLVFAGIHFMKRVHFSISNEIETKSSLPLDI